MWYQGYTYYGKEVNGVFFDNMVNLCIVVCLNNGISG